MNTIMVFLAMKNIKNVLNKCTTSYDAYNEVCSKLARLCPRLVPSPLWGLSLARVVRMAPQAALTICDSCPEIVEKAHRYWMSLNRSGVCEVCGGLGNEIDEDWLYCVFDEDGNLAKDIVLRNPLLEKARLYKGIAYLQGLRLLCEKCHLAKHQGYAQVHGRGQEALEHLARINQLSLEEVRKLVDKAFLTHLVLSKIRDWTIKIGELEGLDGELGEELEKLLNTMYRKGFTLFGGWLYYQYPKYYEEVEPRIIRETMTVLSEASKKSGTAEVIDGRWIDSLLNIVKDELESKGIHVLGHEFRLFIKYLLEDKRRKRLLEKLVNHASKDSSNHYTGLIPLLLDESLMGGKWMVFVPTSLCPQVFRYMLNTLEKTKLAYSAKIASQRERYDSEKELPIVVYVPTSFAIHYIAEVAEVMRRVLDEFYVNKKIFFKPDLFTEKRIYSGKAGHKPYIYIY